MIEKIKILDLVQSQLEGTERFLVNLKVTPDNRIFIDIDGDNGVTIDDCIELSRAVEGGLDRNEEDFELNVSSAGADQPLKKPRQYRRHVGRDLEVTTLDGRTMVGCLADPDDEGFTLRFKGTKQEPPRDERLAYSGVKRAVVVLKF